MIKIFNEVTKKQENFWNGCIFCLKLWRFKFMSKFLFTSESVTEGHPDKVCDKVSDAVLDAILAQDKSARVACETFCTTGCVTVMGEITTNADIDIPQIVRNTVCEIGYDNHIAGFDGNTCAVMTAIDKQSADIAMGVDNSLELKNGGDDAADGE